MAIPADQLPVGEGMLPDGSRYPFFVSRRELEATRSHSPWKYEESRFIPQAIANPDAIFEGLRRPNQADSLCYSVRPTFDPDDDDPDAADGHLPRYGQAFLVFVTRGPVGCVVFDWEWRTEDGESPGLPEGHGDDFARLLWPPT